MPRIMLVFEHDEISQQLPYALICETRYGAHWDSMRRRRRWFQEFTEKERRDASSIFNLSHSWYVGRGLPERVRIVPSTYELWMKLGAFCASL